MVLVVMKGVFPRGSIEVDEYEEKVRWKKALETVNTI